MKVRWSQTSGVNSRDSGGGDGIAYGGRQVREPPGPPGRAPAMMDARGAPTAASSARLSALSLRLPSRDFGVLDRAYIQLARLPRHAGTCRRHGTSQQQNARVIERLEMLIQLTTAQCRCLVSAELTSAYPINPPCCSVLFALHDFHKNCSSLCAHESVGLVARVPLGRSPRAARRAVFRCRSTSTSTTT